MGENDFEQIFYERILAIGFESAIVLSATGDRAVMELALFCAALFVGRAVLSATKAGKR